MEGEKYTEKEIYHLQINIYELYIQPNAGLRPISYLLQRVGIPKLKLFLGRKNGLINYYRERLSFVYVVQEA